MKPRISMIILGVMDWVFQGTGGRERGLFFTQRNLAWVICQRSTSTGCSSSFKPHNLAAKAQIAGFKHWNFLTGGGSLGELKIERLTKYLKIFNSASGATANLNKFRVELANLFADL